ncbi:GNAT family N-acetyltransferase [Cellulomonas sp. zg-ZUI222]|uniref:GNAT family N-acetyltransferase n=2 Tax=Cellulomonas TaxID=1707 RepID=A0ABX8DB44_9CELL|nr:GNAT family N-acetyltransferase [Cellulomonas wangleii]MBO0901220.1 GNAT family N-acetyltransferase [Cellulomonas sp. zg-ZUI22]MBO0922469.1 GNAT family N-acetyltransferase [Cellulomonas wangleii]MBO0924910.1 GNAT family N-acetyltransferase [Cellulomonas wangleii]QVI63072.1 GNAT family N-acetyltransferase [Cellulomonas wangleii]
MTLLQLTPDLLPTALPSGWRAHVPGPDDVPDLHALRARHEVVARGARTAGADATQAEVTGDGAGTRVHVVVRDTTGAARGWATVTDRAAGRVLVAVVVDPDLDDATGDEVAAALFAWAEAAGLALARARGLTRTQLDSGAFDADPRQQRRLVAAGYARVRRWWQMRRPVGDDDRGLRPTGPGVVVRRLRRAADGAPDERDLVASHDVLEQAFADHFNHHEETFDEFLARLRADPGHRWDHWWIAELVDGAEPAPVGVLIASASVDEQGRAVGSYVEYLGVLRTARGRGVARSLLDAVVTDAAERGRTRVALEVDADSPTGAADLYVRCGFSTSYVTQSWHRYVDVT